jgi:hypothetical protein
MKIITIGYENFAAPKEGLGQICEILIGLKKVNKHYNTATNRYEVSYVEDESLCIELGDYPLIEELSNDSTC